MRDGQVIGIIVGGAVLLLGVGTFVVTRDQLPRSADEAYQAPPAIRKMANVATQPASIRPVHLVIRSGPATTRTVIPAVARTDDPRIGEQQREIERLNEELRKTQAALEEMRRAVATKDAQSQAADKTARSESARRVYEQVLRLKLDRDAGITGSVFTQHLADASFSFTNWRDGLTADEQSSEPAISIGKAVESYKSIQKMEKLLPDALTEAKTVDQFESGETVKAKWKMVEVMRDIIKKAEESGAESLAKAKQHL